jgi:hypothetical protein
MTLHDAAADGSCKLGQASFGAILRSRMVSKVLAASARAKRLSDGQVAG